MVRKLVLAVAAASALMSSGVVLALGVGDINLRSSLNQPLDAEIELLQVRDLSSQEIISSLATPDEFGRAGIERIFFLNDLTFTPVVRPDGKSVIRVTSSRPVREPFLNFLMEVRWPSGRVLREFTLLLDPPLYDPGPVVAAAPVSQPISQLQMQQPVQPVTQPAQPTQLQSSRQTAPYSASGVAPADPLYQDQTPSVPTSDQIRTSSTDTLWEIALRHRPQGASVHQTMLAIQDLNPDAFIGGNINRLRANQNLALPDASRATSRSQSEAIQEVAAQNASWQQGRQTAEPAQRQLDARRRDEAAAAPESTRNGDALRLVGSGEEQQNGGADAGSRNGNGQLRDELDTTKEELDSVRREKAEAESRLADMQSQMETLQRLLELKDEQLAAMQQAMGDSAEAPVPTGEATDTSADQAAMTPAMQEDELIPAREEAILSGAEVPATIDSGESTPVEPVTDEAPVVAEMPAPVEPATTAQEQSFTDPGTLGLLQRMMQNQTFLLAGGALVLLLLLLVLMAVARRNARREEDMADNFIARAAQNSDTAADDTDQFNVALAGYQEEQGSAAAEDPLVEADALIAYGKLGKAADVLSTALESEPERTDLRLKLMEVKGLQENSEGYAEQEAVLRKDGSVDNQIDMLNVRFPAMAAALASSAVSAEDYPEWDEDFLQQDGGPKDSVVETAGKSTPASPEKTSGTDASGEEYDFSGFDVETEPAARQEPVAEESLEEFDLDFDLDDSLAESLAQTDTPKPAVNEKPKEDFDFNFELDEPAAEVSTTPATAEEEFTLDEDFDLSLTDDLETAESDELDLAAKSETELKPLETELEPMEEEQTVDLSDSDLEGFDADFEGVTEELNVKPDTELELLEEEQTVDLSDSDLEGFEAELEEPQVQEEADEVKPAPEAEEKVTTRQPDLADEGEDEDEFDFLSGTDESATKLDLARAYIDMGDQEGARDILTEVLEEGNEQQKQEAQDMMGQLD